MSEPYEVATPKLDARTDGAARQFASFLDTTLQRLSSLAFGVATVAVVIGAATYATGFWAFDGSSRTAWMFVGAAICAIPVVAGIAAWLFVHRTVHHVPRLLADVRSLLGQSKQAFAVVIDHDSGQPVATTARSLTKLSGTMQGAPEMYPSLRAAVAAGMKVPGLVALAVVSALLIGAFGTILLLVALLG
ncbi:MAG: hypothetical protein QM733_20035 [Ilumatobacteraceae bacterium]